MSIFTRNRIAAVAALTVATFALGTSTASAADTTDVTVTGGSLTITNPTVDNFTGVTLNGSAQTTTAALASFSVSDLRGTGTGWNVTVGASQFTEVNLNGTAVTSPRTLALNSLTMTAPTVASPDTTSGDPTMTAGTYTIDGGTSVKIASAAVDAGMGTYNFTNGTALSLALPANTYALDPATKAYRSTVTVSVISGP